jgi:hypothetical protein
MLLDTWRLRGLEAWRRRVGGRGGKVTEPAAIEDGSVEKGLRLKRERKRG